MKSYHPICAILIVAMLVMLSCGGPRRPLGEDTIADNAQPAPWDLIDENDYLRGNPLPTATAPEDSAFDYEDSLETDTPEEEETETEGQAVIPQFADSVSPMPQGRISRYNRIGRLSEVFNDSNKYQYAMAEKIGIKPIHSLVDAYYINRPMVEIKTCDLYAVDTLRHSMPWLVPEAANLLETIARNFADSLKSRNVSGHRFRVTSLLRTSQTVKKLRRVNRNATDSSTHKFGTTFDISYAHFNHDRAKQQVSDEELKYILAEVLRDLRRQNKCMVKFERHTPCFHITATGR